MTDEDILKYFENKKIVFWNKLPKEIIEYLQNRYNDNSSNNIKESYLRILNHIEEIPKCPICGNSLKFHGHSYKDFYKLTCGKKQCYSKLAKINRDEYNLKHYGVKETWQREDCKDNCKKTWKEKYGVDNPYNIKEVKQKCIKNSQSKKAIEKRKKTCLEKYGVENAGGSQQVILKIKKIWKNKTKDDLLNIANKRKKTCKIKYNKEFYQSTDEFKEKMSKTISSKDVLDKRKKTCLKKYGIECYNNQKKHNQTIKEKYGNSNFFLTEHYKTTSYQTKKKNNSFNTSKPEDECYELLKTKYQDVKRQYRSDLYPFDCDFYIPDLDLYIEYNGIWTHGLHPYDPDNIEDQKKLQLWKDKDTNFYRNGIETWTIRDIRKRNIAKENKLNFIEFWNIEEVKEWLDKN